MNVISNLVEIISKLEELYYIRQLSELENCKKNNISFEREERKIRKQFENKIFLTQCLAQSKAHIKSSQDTVFCQNNRINASLYCFKHQNLETITFQNELDYLFKNINDFWSKEQSTQTDVLHNVCLLSFQEFVQMIEHFMDKALYENLVACHKRYVKQIGSSSIHNLILGKYENIFQPFMTKNTKKKTISNTTSLNNLKCFARTSIGNQCTNNTYKTKKNYCAIHQYKQRYGDIREALRPENVCDIQQKKKTDYDRNMRIISTLPDIIRYYQSSTFIFKDMQLNQTNSNTLKIMCKS